MSIENKQMIWISGCIDKIIYDNKKGFMIFVLRKKTNSIIVKGEFLQIPLKSSIRILGYYVRDKKYGKQFSAISYQFVIPENIYSWQKWLASGIIKGIRTKNARKIIDYFGEDTMNILNGQPEELAKVPGISLRQANIICDKFQEHIGFQRNENNPLETDTVIIDESSMIDQSLMYALLKAIPKNCQLILVGDKNQLPSVGAGRILADIIAADICPVIELKKIYRQSEESYIAEAAHGILEGKVPYPWGKDKKIKDFYFIPVDYSDKEKAATVISEYAGKKVPAFAHNDVQVLTMTRVRATGCQELNEKIKEITNPSDRSKREYKNFREGDKVIQMKNNYKLERIYPDKKKSIGVFNGDTGKIIEINDNDENIIVRMDDESIVSYSYEDIEQVELAYAITVHKSQGSEYPVVLIPVFDFIPNLTDRQIIYTAITRAKEMVVLAGDYKKLQMMIRNIRSVKRYTRLEYLLKARS